LFVYRPFNLILRAVVNPKSYVSTDWCCSGVSVVSGSSGDQAGGSLNSELLLSNFQILGGTADHGCSLSRFHVVFTLEFQKQRDHQNLFHFALRLRPEFETLRSSILHRHPLPSLTEAMAEFTSEETRLRMLSLLSAPVQSVSSPTALIVPYHPPISRGPQNREPYFHGKMNRGQQPHGSSTQQVQCTFCKQLGCLILTYRKRERLYGLRFPGPQLLLLHLHQLHSHPLASYHLIISHKLPISYPEFRYH